MRFKLLVTPDFLWSDYLPQICMFTGSTEHLIRSPLTVTPEKARHQPSNLPRTGSLNMARRLPIPRIATAWTVTSVESLARHLLGFSIFFTLLFGLGVLGTLEEQSKTGRYELYLSLLTFFASLLCLCLVALWWNPRVRLIQNNAMVEITWPRRLKSVYEAYRQAYERYLADGSPPPDEKPGLGEDPGAELGMKDDARWDQGDEKT